MRTDTPAPTSDIGTLREPQFLTMVEAAKRTGVSFQTIRRRVKDGTIPAILLVGKWRIREDDLRAWVEAEAA
jgi:excisionase family DNA binding protein